MAKSSFSIKTSDNTRLYILLGVFLFAIIIGTIIGSSYNNRETFGNYKKLVYLYMDGCTFCKDFDATWNAIDAEVKNNPTKYDFVTEKYDLNKDTIGAQYAKDNNIEYAPAILFVSSRTFEYSGNTRGKDEILKWASEQKNFNIGTIVNKIEPKK